VNADTATKPTRERRGGRLRAYVARVGHSLVAVRAWDETDARDRVLEQFRLGYLIGAADDIDVRAATPADAEQLDRFEGGSLAFRLEWARDARAQTVSS
jgi:hypothetical protein